jgi:hypothetical protein
VFQNINSDKTLKKIDIENDKLSGIDPNYRPTDNGQVLTGYFKDNKLVKVTYSLGLSFCIKTFDFYLEDQNVIFIYERQQNFVLDEKTSSLDYTKLKTAFDGRYYIHENKLIRKTVKGNLNSKSVEAIDLLHSKVPEFLRMLSTQNSNNP